MIRIQPCQDFRGEIEAEPQQIQSAEMGMKLACSRNGKVNTAGVS